MLQYFFTLLPFSFAILQLIAYFMHRDKTETQNLMVWLIATAAVYLFSDAMYVLPEVSNYRSFLIADIITHFVTPMLPFVLFLVIFSFRHPSSQYRKYYPLAAIATFYGTACLTVTLLAGFGNVADFYQSYAEHRTFLSDFDTPMFRLCIFLNVYLYYALLSVEMLLVLGYVIYYLRRKHFGLASLWRFVFKGGEATPLIIICWCSIAFSILAGTRMAFGRFFWMEHTNFSAVISILFAFLVYSYCSIGMVAHMYEGTLREMLHPLMLAPQHDADNNPLEAVDDGAIPDEERITDELIDLMENKLFFRNPNITIEDVAMRLNVDRTVVVHIIERHMSGTFREYTNRLRVLHAERYMTLHPFETQEKVARESGFADAAAFNKKFRQINGCTPREWSNQQKRQAKQRTR